MAIYKTITKNGEAVKVKVSSHKQKAEIMRINKWSAKEYKRQYDLFKNKLRAYESFRRFKGAEVQKQSASELLYKQAKAKETARKAGERYKPSIAMKRINAMPAISSGKAGQKALQGKIYISRREEYFKKGTKAKFKGFIKHNELAKEMVKNIKDPIKLEEALSAYAEKIHAKEDEQERIQEASAVPYSLNAGSPDDVDFDYSEYL